MKFPDTKGQVFHIFLIHVSLACSIHRQGSLLTAETWECFLRGPQRVLPTNHQLLRELLTVLLEASHDSIPASSSPQVHREQPANQWSRRKCHQRVPSGLFLNKKRLAAMKPLFWWMAGLSMKTQVSASYNKKQELWIDARNLYPYILCEIPRFVFLVFGICRDQKDSQVNNKMPYFTNKNTEQSHKFEVNNEYLNTLKCPLLVINSN